MKKKSSIIKLSIIGVVLILGIVLSFVSMNFGNKTFKSFSSAINFGQDLKGGVYAVFTVDESDSKEDLDVRLSDTRAKLQDMLANKGYTEASVVIVGNDSIRVETPDYNSPGNIFNFIGTPAQMKFTDGAGNVLAISNEHIDKVTYGGYYDASSGYVVTMVLNREGSKLYNKADGTVSISATVSGEETTMGVASSTTSGGKVTVVAGLQSEENAYYLVDRIAAGRFDVMLTLSEAKTLEPTFGKNTLLLGSLAILSGLVLIFAFMILKYKLFGAVAAASLLIFSIIMLFLLSVIPGLIITVAAGAGLILALALITDSAISFCERVKYEYKNGKSILASFYAGFKKAFRSSIDTHAVVAIAAAALFIFGTTAIKTFAAVLFIGTILSFLTLFLIVRGLSRYALAIDYVSEKLYGLKRGEAYVNLGSDETDASILAEMERESAENAKEGGLNNETV